MPASGTASAGLTSKRSPSRVVVTGRRCRTSSTSCWRRADPKSPYVDKQWAQAFPSFLQAQSVEQATSLFRDNFERPRDPGDIHPRLAYANSARDSGNYGNAQFSFDGTGPAIPEPAQGRPGAADQQASMEPAPADQAAAPGSSPVIDVPEAAPPEITQVAVQDEYDPDPYQQPGLYAEGGAIPDDYEEETQNFQGGGMPINPDQPANPSGNPDPYNANRAYTQPIPQQPACGCRERIKLPTGAGTQGVPDWRSWQGALTGPEAAAHQPGQPRR